MKLPSLVLTLLLYVNVFGQYTKYVDPMIGTGGHGHTFPGATTPFGMIQLSPDTRIDGSWDGCSGYHSSDSIIYGFSHTHLSGTGCSDYGDIAFMPSFSKKKESKKMMMEKRKAVFHHENEKAEAGYYSVLIPHIQVELTATTRAGMQRYMYDEDGIAAITLDLNHRDELLNGSIVAVNKTTYKGYRRSRAWAKDQLVYYAFEVSQEPSKVQMLPGGKKEQGMVRLVLYFNVKKGQQLLIKTGLSTVDEEGASRNLNTEMPGWDFEGIRSAAVKSWNSELGKIEVTDADESRKKIFYTALYHCMIHPNVLNDVDGRYRGRDRQVHKAEGFNYYTVFSLWDTHRALHPLLNIIDPKRSHDFVRTFLEQYKESGRLPMWELWGNETNCMIGFHSVSVILDAYKKEVIERSLLEEIYTAVKAEAMSDRFGLPKFREKGYLEIEDESESVSKTLEYSYDMWCVAEIAGILQKTDDEKYFRRLSYGWQNVYDTNKGFMRPRKNGGWLSPFDPYEVNNNYTEANAWQYSFFVPPYSEHLPNVSRLFTAKTKTTGREQSDISGLIGQYAHGNEPSHNFAYLLSNLETQKYVKQILTTLYGAGHDGLCGNEDCGQMSAWYVLSAMGFYPVCPGNNEYALGYPLFAEVKIHTGNNTVFTIRNNRSSEYYTTAVLSNASGTFGITRLHFEDLQLEGTLTFGNTKTAVTRPEAAPLPLDESYLPAPIINAEKQVFKGSNKITFEYPFLLRGGSTIYYSTTYSNPDEHATPYTAPIDINASTNFFAVLYQNGHHSVTTHAWFKKLPTDWEVTLHSQYNKQYTADGPDGLIDGLRGETDWRKGRWQGYQAQDFEAVIDMKTDTLLHQMGAGFLQDTRSWILMPLHVDFFTSADGVKWTPYATVKNTVHDTDMTVQLKEFITPEKPVTCRYIKVSAKNYGKLPAWHPGAGGDAFIFTDEIWIK